MSNPFRYFNSSPEVIRLVVMMYVRYPLSLRNVEDLLAERGIDISHETVQFWWNRFSPMFAAEIRKRRVAHMRGRPRKIVTDGLRAYSAAMREVGNADRQEVGRRLNNRAENSHQPFRRRERAMLRFRSVKTLQKFSSVHAQVHNHFSHERHLITRQVYKQRRSATLAEWRALAA